MGAMAAPALIIGAGLATGGIGAGLLGAGALGTAMGAATGASVLSSTAANYQSMKYQSQVAQNNANLASENAKNAASSGQEALQNVQLQNASQQGAIRATLAANGIQTNSGSAVDIARSAGITGELNAETTSTNTARQVQGYENQETNFENQKSLYNQGADNSLVNGALSMVTGVGKEANMFPGNAVGDATAVDPSFTNAFDNGGYQSEVDAISKAGTGFSFN